MTSCKEGGSAADHGDLDLMSYGLPIKIQAPSGAKVSTEDLGFMKDVTVKGDGNFSLQILNGTASTTDVSKIIQEQMDEAKAGPFFAEVVQEDASGFIFKKQVTEERINYDFRSVKIQGDQEYIFRTGMMGQFTLDEVKAMYDSVQ